MKTIAVSAQNSSPERDPSEWPLAHAIERGFSYLESQQLPSGAWPSDYGGPLFLTPGYVFAHYATQSPLDRGQELGAEIGRCQNADGGFGLHTESPSFLFTTVLNYVALRLLGWGAADPALQRARTFILREPEGALFVPSWGKFWLAIMNLYDWEGVHPAPPELWLMPRGFALHPGRWWCHFRVIFLPLSFLFRKRFQAPLDPLLREIRAEIYPRPFEQIDFRGARSLVAKSDLRAPATWPLRLMQRATEVAEQVFGWVPTKGLSDRATAFVIEQIKAEQRHTEFIDLGPVNKALNVVALFAAEGKSSTFTQALAALPQYLAVGESGLKMQGYNNSELWDTGFAYLAMQAAARQSAAAKKAHRFIDQNQVVEELREPSRYFRDASRGGWPFSNRAHGWPIVDCTALGILAALKGQEVESAPIRSERLEWAVDRLLQWQNDDGGWPTYEKNRGAPWLEHLNPSEIFGDIMVDYSYVELTSSAVQALAAMMPRVDVARARRIRQALARGERYLRRQQRADGSWEGAWGVCFTYGTWWGCAGLAALGAPPEDESFRRATRFLQKHQAVDGGWGESYKSCLERRYIQHPDGSQVVMTAWAVLALLATRQKHARSLAEAGVRYLVRTQCPDGDWPRQGVTGVFNKTCMIHYRYYRNYFPLWALAEAKHRGLRSAD